MKQFFSVNNLPDIVFYNASYVDDSILCSKCDQFFGLWKQLYLASKPEYDLIDWSNVGTNMLVLMLEKGNLNHLTIQITRVVLT